VRKMSLLISHNSRTGVLELSIPVSASDMHTQSSFEGELLQTYLLNGDAIELTSPDFACYIEMNTEQTRLVVRLSLLPKKGRRSRTRLKPLKSRMRYWTRYAMASWTS
jgi:hypothetical protein